MRKVKSYTLCYKLTTGEVHLTEYTFPSLESCLNYVVVPNSYDILEKDEFGNERYMNLDEANRIHKLSQL